ncbi:cyclic dehypoxanthinyl futalosine synthase [Miltoncostaea marina]|uniref:cyclic dehypoxanthinyl futalosine synthase n=1 Tax=Miltoncostaea marina TaxID=2843215 RepID=UPI001C3E7B65|nr:cyclic dehypoxanthinyl futalosine synthase [Miltoncostaea marina]
MSTLAPSRVEEILAGLDDGGRLSDEDALTLLASRDLVAVGEAAARRRDATTDPGVVTFVVDRNVNYTNFCITDCDFCAFYRRPMDPEGYVLPKSVIFRKIEETLDLGGTALLLQGGHHPNLRIEWYEDLFADIKSRYPIHLHALSPSEILHIATVSKLTLDETMARLRAAGHDSLPGGGAEILVDRVRQVIAPRKTTTDEWLGVMRAAHRAGMSTTATMMYGTVDTLEDRVEHLRRLREVQDEGGGFRAFVCWSYQSGGGSARGDDHAHTTAADYLMTLAVSRLYLDNFPHFQSSWVTQGLRVGQLALEFGCDDMGSIMIEENVVRAAGTAFRLDTERMVRAIEATGRRAVQRDTLYRAVRTF